MLAVNSTTASFEVYKPAPADTNSEEMARVQRRRVRKSNGERMIGKAKRDEHQVGLAQFKTRAITKYDEI